MLDAGTICLITRSGTMFDGYTASILEQHEEGVFLVLIRDAFCVTVPRSQLTVICKPVASQFGQAIGDRR